MAADPCFQGSSHAAASTAAGHESHIQARDAAETAANSCCCVAGRQAGSRARPRVQGAAEGRQGPLSCAAKGLT